MIKPLTQEQQDYVHRRGLSITYRSPTREDIPPFVCFADTTEYNTPFQYFRKNCAMSTVQRCDPTTKSAQELADLTIRTIASTEKGSKDTKPIQIFVEDHAWNPVVKLLVDNYSALLVANR